MRADYAEESFHSDQVKGIFGLPMEVVAHLVEVSGGSFPGLGGEVDVVGVVDLAEMVETTSLQAMSAQDPPFRVSSYR